MNIVKSFRNNAFLIFLLLLLFGGAVFGFADEADFLPDIENSFHPVILDGDLSIHFLELGNRFTGDCVYINYRDIDILIDAGSRQSSAATIMSYIDNYVTDGRLEYVIATHAHQDHIAGFYSTRTVTGIFDSYEIGLIIDFPNTNSTTVTYTNYRNARDSAVSRGAVHYTALQCYYNMDGAQRIYELGEDLQLEILYNYFYDNKTSNENNYSVCIKITHGDYQYIFTGDLELEGEDRLVDYYDEFYGGLGRSKLYKGGHHGSSTSGNAKLLAAIAPEYVCICSCVGSSEYRALPANVFPSQGFIDRIAPYTDRVYVTTFVPDYSGNVYVPFNGNIIFLVSGGNISVICSNNDTKLKDTEWFLTNRRMPDAWVKEEYFYEEYTGESP